MNRRILATWILLLFVAAWVSAQLGPSLNLPTVEYNPVLLLDRNVQRELKLSPQVSGKVLNVMMEEGQKLLPAIGSNSAQSPTQKTKTMFAAVNRMQTRLTAMLTPVQKARLRQLTLQSIGPASVLQPRVATQLGLSPAQRGKLSNAFATANKSLAVEMSRRSTTQDWQARMAQMGRLQAASKASGEKTLMATLTAPQRAKWKALQGKPFPLSGFLGSGGMMSGMGG